MATVGYMLPEWMQVLVANKQSAGPDRSNVGQTGEGATIAVKPQGEGLGKVGTFPEQNYDLTPAPAGGNPRMDRQKKIIEGQRAKQLYEDWAASRMAAPTAPVQVTKAGDVVPVNPQLINPNPMGGGFIPPPEAKDKTTTADADPIESIVKRITDLIGTRPSDSEAQKRADAYAADDLRRTKYLAQLALASGVTSAGGGNWKDVGVGFGRAAAVYDQGFSRYQDALQGAADREFKSANQRFADKASVVNSAFDIYNANRAAQLDRQKQIANSTKDAIGWVQKMYSDEAASLKDAGGFTDPASVADLNARRLEAIRLTQKTGVPQYVGATHDLTK